MQRVQVLGSEVKEGIGKVSKAAYKMEVLQAAVWEGGKCVATGELILPKDHAPVKPGDYSPTFALAKGKDGGIVARVSQLTPVKV